MNTQTLPIIDISPLFADDQSALDQVAAQIDRACCDWGFFYITGHGITQAQIDAVIGKGIQFFALPEAEKIRLDAQAIFSLCGSDMSELPCLRFYLRGHRRTQYYF